MFCWASLTVSAFWAANCSARLALEASRFSRHCLMTSGSSSSSAVAAAYPEL